VRAASQGAVVACGCDGSAGAGLEARVAQANGGRPGARASAERAGRALRRSKPAQDDSGVAEAWTRACVGAA
jgi:hypothetical protein